MKKIEAQIQSLPLIGTRERYCALEKILDELLPEDYGLLNRVLLSGLGFDQTKLTIDPPDNLKPTVKPKSRAPGWCSTI